MKLGACFCRSGKVLALRATLVPRVIRFGHRRSALFVGIARGLRAACSKAQYDASPIPRSRCSSVRPYFRTPNKALEPTSCSVTPRAIECSTISQSDRTIYSSTSRARAGRGSSLTFGNASPMRSCLAPLLGFREAWRLLLSVGKGACFAGHAVSPSHPFRSSPLCVICRDRQWLSSGLQ